MVMAHGAKNLHFGPTTNLRASCLHTTFRYNMGLHYHQGRHGNEFDNGFLLLNIKLTYHNTVLLLQQQYLG
jgi:hypothetical protein